MSTNIKAASGNKHILVIVDCFSKWCKTITLKSIDGNSVTKVFFMNG